MVKAVGSRHAGTSQCRTPHSAADQRTPARIRGQFVRVAPAASAISSSNASADGDQPASASWCWCAPAPVHGGARSWARAHCARGRALPSIAAGTAMVSAAAASAAGGRLGGSFRRRFIDVCGGGCLRPWRQRLGEPGVDRAAATRTTLGRARLRGDEETTMRAGDEHGPIQACRTRAVSRGGACP